MTQFKPFSGWRYNPEKVVFTEVIAPPYDVISPSGQEDLYNRSPINCIRLILNQETPEDNDSNNRYTRAKKFFTDWCENGTLIQDSSASYYIYRQTFKDPTSGAERTRTAVIGRVKLEPYENKVVIRHELTLSKPRKDRTRLLETTQSIFSPIFGLYEDKQDSLSSIFQNTMTQEPIFNVEDDDKIQHALWVVGDESVAKEIQSQLSDKKLYIADGHHRYQTALDYALAQRKQKNVPENESLDSDYTIMALVEFHDPGLVLYPTHRLIHSFQDAANASFDGENPEAVIEPLKEYFDVQEADRGSLQNKVSGTSDEQIAFGLLLGNYSYLLTLKSWQKAKEVMMAGKSDVWYKLDVNILSHLMLAVLWKFPEASWENVLTYTHSTEEALSNVENKSVNAALLLKAPKVEILRDMGEVDELLPQKSTYFYPKLASGLVFYHHEKV